MSHILAIDPGCDESAYVVINAETYQPIDFAKVENHELRLRLGVLTDRPLTAVVEMVASYGMPVGREVFETCTWIGRFVEALESVHAVETSLVYRQPIKLHLCHTSKAKDSNITQALVDRFAPGQKNHGKGTKAQPGFFYGFKADIWAAFALAVYVADTRSDAS